MLVIAHGQPKSGSTFLYKAALEICEHVNSESFYRFRDRVFGADFPVFQQQVAPETLEEMDRAVGPGRLFVVKTHGKLTSELSEVIARGKVRAFTSFRDPRDSALSTLNVGEMDRAAGRSRWFAKIEEIDQLARAIRNQALHAFAWVRHESVLAIPYYLIATSEGESVARLARFLGLPHLATTLAYDMAAKRSSVPEFNKGIVDRFVHELSREQLEFCEATWGDLIAEYDQLLTEHMARLGHRMVHLHYTALRDQALRAKMAGIMPAPVEAAVR